MSPVSLSFQETHPRIHSFNQRCPIQSRLQSVLGVRSFYVERNKEELEKVIAIIKKEVLFSGHGRLEPMKYLD